MQSTLHYRFFLLKLFENTGEKKQKKNTTNTHDFATQN